jgi:predicted DNA-binding antitoxin AbrB/MazE fold protein
MANTFNAVYRDGAFYPEVPPELPEGSAVEILVVKPRRARLVGQAACDHLREIARLFDATTDRPEVTSENVDEILFGKKGDPGDVR